MISTVTPSTGRDEHSEVDNEQPCFALTGLLDDLQPHTELDLRTLAYHARQSDATAADGYHHAAINEARSVLEALVVGVVRAVRCDGENGAETPPGERAQNGTAFRTYRRYLLESGFVEAEENDLLQYVYSMASARGSHHGVPDEAWTRLARRMVFIVGQYVVQRYADWKRAGRPGAVPVASRGGFWRRWRTFVASSK